VWKGGRRGQKKKDDVMLGRRWWRAGGRL